jgi:hypothetical protein
MNFRSRTIVQLALSLVLTASCFAADQAYLYVVQGMPGRDVADSLNPGLPIDILINGDCMVRGLSFASTAGPYTLSPATYDVEISWANTLAPCTNSPEITTQVALGSGANESIVAALSTEGQPALLQLGDNLSPITSGDARFVFANTADASALQATLTQVGVQNPKTFTVTAAAGAQAVVVVPAGTYLVQVIASGGTTVLASEQMELANQAATFTYAAGEAANNTVGLINRVIRDVF